MCFSAEVSFASAAVLMPIGLHGMAKAIKCNKRYLLFLSVPFLFGIQQLMEGIVWNELHAADVLAVHNAALIYLFFAYFLWPIYIPASVYFIENQSDIKKWMKRLFILGLVLSAIIYLPILSGDVPLTAAIVQHSIQYSSYQSELVIRTGVAIYAVIVILSLALSSVKLAKWFAFLVFLAIIISIYWYYYAFTSVWCFFSAIVSVFIAMVAYRLDSKAY